MSLLLYANEDDLEQTFRLEIRLSIVNSSSARPSLKYSFSFESLMLTKGNTAIDGPWFSSSASSLAR